MVESCEQPHSNNYDLPGDQVSFQKPAFWVACQTVLTVPQAFILCYEVFTCVVVFLLTLASLPLIFAQNLIDGVQTVFERAFVAKGRGCIVSSAAEGFRQVGLSGDTV